MNEDKQIKELKEQKDKIENQLRNLQGNKLVHLGMKWTHKLTDQVTRNKFTKQLSKYSFSDWKKNYVVLKRTDYAQLKHEVGFYQAKYRSAMLRSNNRNTPLR